MARMRRAILPHLPERAFLRRDRGDGLLITNAPMLDSQFKSIPGFSLLPQGALMRILPEEVWIEQIEAQAPADALSESLLRFRGERIDAAGMRLFCQGCKLLDAASEGEILAFDRALRQRAACALRGEAGGAIYACALLNARLQARREDA